MEFLVTYRSEIERASIGRVEMERVEAVYREHHVRLWRSLLAYTGDADLASEAAAETFTQAVARGKELRDPAAWIWRSAFKIAGGIMSERRSRSEDRPIHEVLDLIMGEMTFSASPLVEFVDSLMDLPAQRRAVVVLRYAGGFSAPEIAEVLGTSANTVRVQLHRAHGQLRDRIEQT